MSSKSSRAFSTLLCLVLCSCGKPSEEAKELSRLKDEISSLRGEMAALRAHADSELNTVRSGQRTDEINTRLEVITKDLEQLKTAKTVSGQNAPPVLPRSEDIPFGTPVVGRAGMVYSPYAAEKGPVDVAGLKRGTRVKCPYTGKNFRAP